VVNQARATFDGTWVVTRMSSSRYSGMVLDKDVLDHGPLRRVLWPITGGARRACRAASWLALLRVPFKVALEVLFVGTGSRVMDLLMLLFQVAFCREDSREIPGSSPLTPPVLP